MNEFKVCCDPCEREAMCCEQHSCCVECHCSFEEIYALPYLPRHLAAEIRREHAELQAAGWPREKVLAHSQREMEYFRAYCPAAVLRQIDDDHEAYEAEVLGLQPTEETTMSRTTSPSPRVSVGSLALRSPMQPVRRARTQDEVTALTNQIYAKIASDNGAPTRIDANDPRQAPLAKAWLAIRERVRTAAPSESDKKICLDCCRIQGVWECFPCDQSKCPQVDTGDRGIDVGRHGGGWGGRGWGGRGWWGSGWGGGWGGWGWPYASYYAYPAWGWGGYGQAQAEPEFDCIEFDSAGKCLVKKRRGADVNLAVAAPRVVAGAVDVGAVDVGAVDVGRHGGGGGWGGRGWWGGGWGGPYYPYYASYSYPYYAGYYPYSYGYGYPYGYAAATQPTATAQADDGQYVCETWDSAGQCTVMRRRTTPVEVTRNPMAIARDASGLRTRSPVRAALMAR